MEWVAESWYYSYSVVDNVGTSLFFLIVKHKQGIFRRNILRSYKFATLPFDGNNTGTLSFEVSGKKNK